MPQPARLAKEPPRVLPVPAASWILYDVADTVYAATITFLFAGYVQLRGGLPAMGWTQTISMVLAGLAAPLFAAIADRTGRARGYLTITSLLCIAALASFAADLPMAGLMLVFGVANFAYNSALVFYNSLLPSVAPMRRAGLISGLGVGLGYLGTLAILAILLPREKTLGAHITFALAAGLYLLLALPCMLTVRERRVVTREPLTRALVRERFLELWSTIKGLRRDRDMRRFLLGNFLCVDVINTAILYFGVYSTTVFSGQVIELFGMRFDLRPHVTFDGHAGMAVPDKVGFLMLIGVALNALALVAGVMLGVLADRWGALKSMRASAFCLTVALMGGSFFWGGGFSSPQLAAIASEGRDEAGWRRFADETGAKLAPPDMIFVDELRNAPPESFALASSSISLPKPPLPDAALERPAGVPWHPLAYFFALTVFGAFGLAGIWTAGRKALMELAPRERLGEYFGLHGISLKLSVIGSTTFALLMEYAGARWAMLAQALPLAIGLILLMLVGRGKADGNPPPHR